MSRLLTRKQAAAYLSMSLPTFTRLVNEGSLPASMPFAYRWDKKALDSFLDTLSRLESPTEMNPLDEWIETYARAPEGDSHHDQTIGKWE